MKTPRALLIFGLLCGLGATLAAQDQQPEKKDGIGQDGKSKDILARVAKDMKNSFERLEKTDPGDETRKIQRDIIDGLDELIKQNANKSQGGGGGSKSAKMKQSGGGQKQSMPKESGEVGKAQDKQGNPKNGQDDAQELFGQAKGSDDKGPHGQEKDKGDGKDEKEADAKDGGKDGNKGEAKPHDPGKDGADQGGLAKIRDAKPKSKSDVAADLHRTDWGHLPLTKRLEMDAYSKERFMPRYDEALQQYYRNIAEQGQKKDN